MKITYYTIGNTYRYQAIPKSLKYRNLATFDKAIEAVKANYKPFEYPHLSVELTSVDVWGMIPQQEFSHFENPRKKENPVYKTVEYPGIVKNFNEYNCSYCDFIKPNSYGGWLREDLKGFYNLKVGEVQEIKDEEGIAWKVPVFVQFKAAERIYAPEMKEVGKPYSPAKHEVIEKEPVSDWLPIYMIRDGRYAKYVIDQKSRGTWDRWEQYVLTDRMYINKVELEIEE